MARPRNVRGRDAGITSVPALVIIVAITVTMGAVAYTAFTGFKAEGDLSPAVALMDEGGRCVATLRVVGAAEDARWNDFDVRVEGASAFSVRAAGHTTQGLRWEGKALVPTKPILSGEAIEVAVRQDTSDDLLVYLTHAPSNSVAARILVPRLQPDEAPPQTAVGVTNGSVVSSFGIVPGTTADPCSGPGTTRVAILRVSDNYYLHPGGTFQPTPSWWTGEGSSWAISFGDVPCTMGNYQILAVGTDFAGNEANATTVDVSCLPAGTTFDPGYAYQDVNNDFLYTPGTDLPISNATIRSGLFVAAPGNGLVIPPIVGPITIASEKIEYTTSGVGHITIGVTLTAHKEIKLTAGGDVRVHNATLRSTTEKIELLPGRGLFATGTTLDAHKEIKIDSLGLIELNASSLDSAVEKITIKTTSTGTLYAYNASILAHKLVELLTANGHLLADDATIRSTDEKVDLKSSTLGWAVSAKRANIDAKTSFTVDGKGHIHVEGADLYVTSGPITLKTTSTSYSVNVAATRVDDDNNKAKAEPSGVPINGTPSFGQVNYSG